MPDAGSVWVDVLPDLKRFGPRLRAELQKHANKGMDVPVGLDSAKAKAELDVFKRQLDEVGRQTATAKVSANTRSALTSLVGVEKAIDRIDGRVVNVRVNTTGGSVSAPAAPRTAPASGGGGGGSSSRTGLAGFGQGQQQFSDVSPAGVLAITTLIPPLIPAVGALAGGLGAVASGFTAAGVGAAGFALAAIPAIQEANAATGDLTDGQEAFKDAMGGLTASWRQFRAETDRPVLRAAADGIGVANVGLRLLTPATQRTAHALSTLSDEAREALGNDRWQSFFGFVARQATPSTLTFGRSIGNLTSGLAGLVMNMEPLWNVVAPGLENLTSRFAAWGHETDNFQGFIAWTIENGPTFVDLFGSISSAAVDVGVALAPLGVVYAEGLTALAGALSAVAENAPWLLQLAVAALTARSAIQVLGYANQGIVQPLRELPGRVREYATNLGAVGTAADGAAAGTRGFRGALSGAVGALGGPWGIAIGAGIAALGLFAAAKANASQKVREYTDAIREDSGALGENTRAHAIQALEEEKVLERAERLGLNLDQVTDAVLGQTNAQKSLNRELNAQLDALGERLAQGEITQDQYDKEYRLIAQVRGAIQGENAAINEAAGSYRRKTDAMGEAEEAQEGVNQAMLDGAFLARDLKTALDNLTGTTVGVTQAESDFQAAIDSATEAATENGATLDLNTEAGRANESALRTLRDTINSNTEAVRLNDGSVQEQIATAARGREEFVRVARQMGLTADEAEDLADEYLGIPSDVRTAIEVNSRGVWSTQPFQNSSHMSPSNGQSQFYAEGGSVHGPGTATSDSIPAWLSDGEFVQPTHVVDHYGVGFMEALRHKQIPKNAIQGFAKGGWVTRGQGDTPWGIINDHRVDVRENYARLVRMLIGSIGDSMAEDFKNSAQGPMGVVQLAEASLGKYPESNGNNTNHITRWFGMNGAPWCFAAGTLVQAASGLVEIQDIAPGDTVRAPSGADKVVRAVYRRTKPLLRVRVLGAPDTLATADHPYMTERGWVKAGELRRGDKVAKPIPATGNLRVDDDLAHLVGLYVAEGYRTHRDRSITLCVARGEAEDVAALAKRAGYEPHVTQHRTCALVTMYDRALYELLAATGDGAHRKEVPSFVLTWDARGRGRFLEGYVSGDGHRPSSRPGVVACTTVSKRLTVSLAGLLSTLGVSAAIRSTRPARVEVIEGRTVSCREQFVIEWREHPSRKAQHRFAEDVLWVPVRSVVDTGVVDTVYDIQVDDEHAFIANGVHVHNCAMFISWLFAQTGASKALGGAARTAWTGDYYGSGMARTNSPQPGDVAVYGTRHVNLIASPGGGRRIGGNQSNNVTAAPYSGGAIFRPMWDRARFASGGLVSIADIFSQDREEDHRGGMSPLVKTIREISGYASGGTASGWAVVGEEGPELAHFADPARIYSNAESARMLATAAKVSTASRGGDGASAPLVGAINASINSADATVREMVDEITHSLHTVRVGGRFVDD
ncbi:MULTISPECIES: LAGLIDADG family homing endonuclease [unclassified Nocardiopsis]|uniref:LAGLIDADG family homing endonuclease n=1 Tax=Nocardiopsis TaxID=2013 RepID=UPI00387B706C